MLSSAARPCFSVMLRLHLAVLTTRNETWRLWKQLFKL